MILYVFVATPSAREAHLNCISLQPFLHSRVGGFGYRTTASRRRHKHSRWEGASANAPHRGRPRLWRRYRRFRHKAR
jgi:hypothetical protein